MSIFFDDPGEPRAQDRLTMLKDAVQQFKQYAPNASVYIDAGHTTDTSDHLSGAATFMSGATPKEMARWLEKAGVADAAGFSLNVSAYLSTENNRRFGEEISAAIQRDTGQIKHFVIDTSRNGTGGYKVGDAHCNVPDQALGAPSQGFGYGILDAMIWVKNPGESDGNGNGCNGGILAGQFSLKQACILAYNAGSLLDPVTPICQPPTTGSPGPIQLIHNAWTEVQQWMGINSSNSTQ